MAQPMTPTPVLVVALKTEPVELKRELPGRTRAFVIAEAVSYTHLRAHET